MKQLENASIPINVFKEKHTIAPFATIELLADSFPNLFSPFLIYCSLDYI